MVFIDYVFKTIMVCFILEYLGRWRNVWILKRRNFDTRRRVVLESLKQYKRRNHEDNPSFVVHGIVTKIEWWVILFEYVLKTRCKICAGTQM